MKRPDIHCRAGWVSCRTIGLLFLAMLCCSSCLPEGEKVAVTPGTGCLACHQMELDQHHQLACTVCHRGSEETADKDKAHSDLIAKPAHPANASATCGSCHAEAVAAQAGSSHATLANMTNLVRQAYGAKETLPDSQRVPFTANPETPLELADDLLRRRCFSCHLGSGGEDYPATSRGTGCAACHLLFSDGKLASHGFSKPTDERCLSCHYGNYVGADYYGRYEHDLNDEYRTPFTTSQEHFRPYGIEFHQLKADIHQEKGMVCLDCHSGRELMTSAPGPSCENCHPLASANQEIEPKVARSHPAHLEFQGKASCQVCHARWTYDDRGRNLLRQDHDEVDHWAYLTTQGNSEVDRVLSINTSYQLEETDIAMTDKLTGQSSPGIWLQGYVERRWENLNLGLDENGVLTTIRPILDLRLSYVDAEEEVLIDGVAAVNDTGGWRPYTPHTTGPAGLFYRERLMLLRPASTNQQ